MKQGIGEEVMGKKLNETDEGESKTGGNEDEAIEIDEGGGKGRKRQVWMEESVDGRK